METHAKEGDTQEGRRRHTISCWKKSSRKLGGIGWLPCILSH